MVNDTFLKQTEPFHYWTANLPWMAYFYYFETGCTFLILNSNSSLDGIFSAFDGTFLNFSVFFHIHWYFSEKDSTLSLLNSKSSMCGIFSASMVLLCIYMHTLHYMMFFTVNYTFLKQMVSFLDWTATVLWTAFFPPSMAPVDCTFSILNSTFLYFCTFKNHGRKLRCLKVLVGETFRGYARLINCWKTLRVSERCPYTF